MATQDNSAAFVQLLTLNQSRLYAYILSLVGNASHADDVLQETNVVLWQKASEFTLGTNFTAWMFKIAYMQVMAYRQRLTREKILFDSDMVPELAQEVGERLSDLDSRQRSLQACLEKLSPRQRDIVRRRYSSGATVQSMADELGHSVEAIKQLLFRTRLTLAECVKRSLALENA
ncbi:MAG TPA: sigma-70 family RNA polymerase sigma factor [Planctomycetota bacterium]|nr:sigma-70 family RNA polymerase sigma factor [Planctomycetota bacterium]